MKASLLLITLLFQFFLASIVAQDLPKDIVATVSSKEILSIIVDDLMMGCPISEGPSAAKEYLNQLSGFNENADLSVGLGLASYDVVDAKAYGRELVNDNSQIQLMYDSDKAGYGGWILVNMIYCFKYEADKNSLYNHMNKSMDRILALERQTQTDDTGKEVKLFKLYDEYRFSLSQESVDGLHFIEVEWSTNWSSELATFLSENKLSKTSDEMIRHSEAAYAIEYPSNWYLDSNGPSGMAFVIYSPQSDPGDSFSENVNLIIHKDPPEDLATLELYKEASERQIINMHGEENMTLSETNANEHGDYNMLIFSSTQGTQEVKFIQYTIIKNNNVYILTFSVIKSEFQAYKQVAQQILDSFIVK